MGLSTAVGTVTQPASNTTVAETIGFQPEVILFFWNLATADGGHADAATGVGVWCRNGGSPTQHASFAVADDSNTDSLLNDRVTASDCIVITSPAPTVLGLADVSASDSTSFTLNWTSVDGTQRIVHYLALGGDVRGISGARTRPTTTGNQATTGAGAQPTALLTITPGDRATALDTNSSLGCGICVGWGTSSTARGVAGWGGRSGRTTGDGNAYQRTALVAASLSNVIAAEADLVSLDADGFTLNWTTVNARAGYFVWIALWGTSISCAVGSFTTDTDSGAQSITGVGFQPQALLVQSFQKAASATVQTGNDYSFGAAASSTARGAIWAGGANGSATTNESSIFDTDKLIEYADEGNGSPTKTGEADLTSFDADGFTLDWTDASPGAYQALYFAIRGASGGTEYTQSASGAVAIAGGLAKQLARALTGAVTSAGALVLQTGKGAAGTVTTAGVLARSTARGLVGAVTMSGTLSAVASSSQLEAAADYVIRVQADPTVIRCDADPGTVDI